MDAATLAVRLKAVRSGRQWKCRCPAHEDHSPSLIIFDGRESVQVRCLAGCSQDEVIAALDARGLWDKAAAQNRGAALSTPRSTHPDNRRSDLPNSSHLELAQLIFSGALPIAGTIAERYFDGRDLLDVARKIPDIRFAPACPRGRDRQPAVVVAMRHVVTRRVHAVQRIFLKQLAFGAVAKDGTPMMLGPTSGCAMQLHPRGERLHIAEGLESALAVIAMDHRPAWAVGSASLMASLPVISDVAELVIWADNDPVNSKTGKRAGEEAADRCADRWSAAERKVEIMVPRVEGFDAADVWSDRLARQ